MSVTADTQASANPKLPFWRTISLSYSFYFEHLGDVLRVSWLWLLIYMPLVGVTSWLQMSWLTEAIANMKPGRPPLAPATSIELTILGNVSTVVMFLAGCSIAVAWHRLLLLGEHPHLSGSNIVSQSLWRYAGMGIAILLIAGLPALAILAPVFLWGLPHAADANTPAVSAAMSNPAIFILIPIVYLGICFVVMRLCLLLPARAIGDTGLTFKGAWDFTRGNAWRIFWGIVACSVPPLILAQTALWPVIGSSNPIKLMSSAMIGPWIAFNAIFSGYYLLTLPIFIGFLSNAFLFFKRA
jgi:hypothetical protein